MDADLDAFLRGLSSCAAVSGIGNLAGETTAIRTIAGRR